MITDGICCNSTVNVEFEGYWTYKSNNGNFKFKLWIETNHTLIIMFSLKKFIFIVFEKTKKVR